MMEEILREVQNLQGRTETADGLTDGYPALHGLRHEVHTGRIPGRNRRKDMGKDILALL